MSGRKFSRLQNNSIIHLWVKTEVKKVRKIGMKTSDGRMEHD